MKPALENAKRFLFQLLAYYDSISFLIHWLPARVEEFHLDVNRSYAE